MAKWFGCDHVFIEGTNCIFCQKCGKKIDVDCAHIFEVMDKYSTPGIGKGMISSLWFINRCKKCGKIVRQDIF